MKIREIIYFLLGTTYGGLAVKYKLEFLPYVIIVTVVLSSYSLILSLIDEKKDVK